MGGAAKLRHHSLPGHVGQVSGGQLVDCAFRLHSGPQRPLEPVMLIVLIMYLDSNAGPSDVLQSFGTIEKH